MSDATKYDSGKLPLELVPPVIMEEIARVLQFGVEKYGRDNWRKGMQWTRLFGAILRHLFAWVRGEDNDKESGISHLAHAATSIAFLLEYRVIAKEKDDRLIGEQIPKI